VDVGCGPGALAIELARRGLHVHAIDRAAPMAQLARLNALRDGVPDDVRVSMGDAHALPFHDDSFILLIALGLIPWVHSPERAVREMARVVRPGGYLVIQASNQIQLSGFIDRLLSPALAIARTLRRPVRHLLGRGKNQATSLKKTLHRPRDFDRLLSEAGLEKVEATTFGFRPLMLLGRSLVPYRVGIGLHSRLQALANRGVPGVRLTGEQYLVLARKKPTGAKTKEAA
jgi:ubiquinone/menaquinone biosynthesis C-methylase UbiE